MFSNLHIKQDTERLLSVPVSDNYNSFLARDISESEKLEALTSIVENAYEALKSKKFSRSIHLHFLPERFFDYLAKNETKINPVVGYFYPDTKDIVLRESSLARMVIAAFHELGHSESRRKPDDLLYEPEADAFSLLAAEFLRLKYSEFGKECYASRDVESSSILRPLLDHDIGLVDCFILYGALRSPALGYDEFVRKHLSRYLETALSKVGVSRI